MDRPSEYMDEKINKRQYPTREQIIDPYLNNETSYLQDHSVGVNREDRGTHHDNIFYPSQEDQEPEQRHAHSQDWDFKPQDEAMDQSHGSSDAFNQAVAQSERPISFDPRSLFSQIPEMDKEDGHTGPAEGALQPPTRLELAGVGRHGSLYYRAASPGRSPARPPRRSGALRRDNSRYREPHVPDEGKKSPYTTDQGEPGYHGHQDGPGPDRGRLNQQTASKASLYGGDRQSREEAPINTMSDGKIHTISAAKPSSTTHSLASQGAQSEPYPSVPEISQPEIAHNPQASPAEPGSKSMRRPISRSISPASQRDFHPGEQRLPTPGSHVSPPWQQHQAILPRVTPQRPPQPGLQPQGQNQTASEPGNRSGPPQRTSPHMQQRVPVTANTTSYSQGVPPPAPVPDLSHHPSNLHGSQASQPAVSRPDRPQSTPYGQHGSTPPPMVGSWHVQDSNQRAAQRQQHDRPPTMVPSQNVQNPNRKPVQQAELPSQSGQARTQETAAQRPPRGQESYQQHGRMPTQQQQQQEPPPPFSRLQQGAPSAAPYDKTPRPQDFRQPQQYVPGNNSSARMMSQQGSVQQLRPPPLNKVAPSAPLPGLEATARPQKVQQSNEPLAQGYGTVERIMTPQQPPAEPYRLQQIITRSPPPPSATMSPSQRPFAPARSPASTSATDVPVPTSVADVQIPPSTSSTQDPAQRRVPLRTNPTTPTAPLTGESLLSTLVQGRPAPRLDARDPKNGNALMEGPYCILYPTPIRLCLLFFARLINT